MCPFLLVNCSEVSITVHLLSYNIPIPVTKSSSVRNMLVCVSSDASVSASCFDAYECKETVYDPSQLSTTKILQQLLSMSI